MCTPFPLHFYWYTLCLNGCFPLHRGIPVPSPMDSLRKSWPHGLSRYFLVIFFYFYLATFPFYLLSLADSTGLESVLRNWKPCISWLYGSSVPKFCYILFHYSWHDCMGKLLELWFPLSVQIFPSSLSHQKVLNLWSGEWFQTQNLKVNYKTSASGNETRNLCKTWWLWHGER